MNDEGTDLTLKKRSPLVMLNFVIFFNNYSGYFVINETNPLSIGRVELEVLALCVAVGLPITKRSPFLQWYGTAIQRWLVVVVL